MDQVTGITVFVIAFALFLPVLSSWLSSYPRLLRIAKYVIFGVYVLANLYETLLFRAFNDANAVKLEVLWSYREALTVQNDYGSGLIGLLQAALAGENLGLTIASTGLLKQIILNILLYVPLGYLLPFTWNRLSKPIKEENAEARSFLKRFPWRVPLIGFLASCATELTQLIFRIGWFEFDDILNNTMGCFLGCLLYLMVMKRKRNHP
ncbi:MAG: VanZ family protein [Eubacteriales bacterium]|nr:VanZ family protein [Eubacteriales bacterium]